MDSGINEAESINDGFWTFIIAEMFMFLAFFGTYAYERCLDIETYNAAQAIMHVGTATTNTLILIVSSWFVVIAIAAAEKHKPKMTFVFLSLAFLCGVAFCINKFFEYAAKLDAGITIYTNDFFMFYYIITGLHFVHVIAGMTILSVMAIQAIKGAYGPGRTKGLETGATYWHMVDLLWVVIFPLIYLMR